MKRGEREVQGRKHSVSNLIGVLAGELSRLDALLNEFGDRLTAFLPDGPRHGVPLPKVFRMLGFKTRRPVSPNRAFLRMFSLTGFSKEGFD